MKNSLAYSLPNVYTSAQAGAKTINQAYWPKRLSNPDRDPQKSLATKLKNLSRTLLSQLSGSSDPQVWQSKTRDGQVVWNAQDSLTGRVIHDASETEIRIWLENRYRF
ncbi:MAG: hypothetical protein AAFP20_13205 [Cyanobacteria bacterium J06614_10]